MQLIVFDLIRLSTPLRIQEVLASIVTMRYSNRRNGGRKCLVLLHQRSTAPGDTLNESDLSNEIVR